MTFTIGSDTIKFILFSLTIAGIIFSGGKFWQKVKQLCNSFDLFKIDINSRIDKIECDLADRINKIENDQKEKISSLKGVIWKGGKLDFITTSQCSGFQHECKDNITKQIDALLLKVDTAITNIQSTDLKVVNISTSINNMEEKIKELKIERRKK